MLLVNAQSAGDKTEWERLVLRHLEDIGRSDPDLCMSYAVFVHKERDVDGAEEALRWADVALENKQRWSGATHVQRVYALLRVRAEAGHRLWVDAEKRYQRAPTPENDTDVVDFRGVAKDTAREWLDYARASGRSIEAPYEMCVSAAGTREFCTAPR